MSATALLAPTRLAGRVVRPSTRKPVPLRLTRRGKVVLVVLLALAAVGLLALIAAPGSAAEPASARPVVVVSAGDTLWTIAGRCAGSRDRFALIDEIRRANALPDSRVEVGQRLVLPCRQLRAAR